MYLSPLRDCYFVTYEQLETTLKEFMIGPTALLCSEHVYGE